MLESVTKKTTDKQVMDIVLTDTQQEELKRALKRGIYKELHKRNILSDTQLNSLLERNSWYFACTSLQEDTK